jgi:DNA repair ATPase RecN
MSIRRGGVIALVSLILVSILIAGGCGSKQASLQEMPQEGVETISKIVDETITDPERAQQARERLVRLDELIEEFGVEMQRIRTQAFYFNANYDTTTEDYDRFKDDLRRLRETKMEQLIALALDARTVVTEEEWATIQQRFREELPAYRIEKEG